MVKADPLDANPRARRVPLAATTLRQPLVSWMHPPVDPRGHRVSPAHANAHARTNAHVHAAATVEREAAAQFEVVAHDAAVERETAALSAAIGDPVSNSSDESKLCIFESVLVVHYMGAHSVKPEGNGSQAVGITGHVVLHPAMVGCSTTCNVDGPLMNR